MDQFDVTDQLPEDVMHILLEGVCMLHTAVLLRHVIFEEQIITLEFLNGLIKSYKYLSFETKPATLLLHSVREGDLSGKQTSRSTNSL